MKKTTNKKKNESAIDTSYLNKQVVEIAKGLAAKRASFIDRLISDNVPSWQRVLMKKKIGKILGYKIELKPLFPLEGEWAREQITLKRYKWFVAEETLVINNNEYTELSKLLPRDRPDYVG